MGDALYRRHFGCRELVALGRGRGERRLSRGSDGRVFVYLGTISGCVGESSAKRFAAGVRIRYLVTINVFCASQTQSEHRRGLIARAERLDKSNWGDGPAKIQVHGGVVVSCLPTKTGRAAMTNASASWTLAAFGRSHVTGGRTCLAASSGSASMLSCNLAWKTPRFTIGGTS